MSVDYSSRVRQAPNVLIQELGKETVLLSLLRECYYGLNESGSEIWKELVQAETIANAYERLLNCFDVEPEVLQKDLECLINELLERDLIRIISAQAEPS